MISRLESAWKRFWFPEVPLRRLGVFRVIVTAYCLLDVSIFSAKNGRFVDTPDLFYRPLIYVVRLMDVPPPEEPWTSVARYVLIVALALALIGLGTRAALIVAAPLYTWWTALPLAFGDMSHSHLPIIFSLFVLALGPSGKTNSVAGESRSRETDREQAIAGWCFRIVQVFVVSAYLFAAYAKLRHAGVSWIEGSSLTATLLKPGATSLADVMIGHPLLIRAGAVSLLLFELLAPLAFVGGWARNAWVTTAILFHVITFAVFGINFLPWIVAYAVFFDLEVAVDRLRLTLRSRFRYASGAGSAADSA